jgi:hypothetical protein
MSTTPPPAPTPPPAALVDDHDALRPGARLHEFEILKVLGVGGFGIVYLAMDHALDRQVAIKEYMPSSLAARGEGSMVSLRSSAHQETFAIGLKSFVNEAKLLARFDHPSLVKVYRFWEQNGTAYMVMPFYPGRTLKEERRALGRAPGEAWVHQLVEPLFGALELLHREDVFHRDIAPDNILLSLGAPPVLLDFGAARRVIGDRTQTLTAILKPNFAPIEQYADVSHLRQGPWTDLYALGAVLHFVVTGKPPMPAAARAVHDELPPLGAAGGPYEGTLSPALLKSIDWALAVKPQDRPQNVSQLREAMAGRLQPPERPVVDIGMAPTLPAERVVQAWARTEPVGGATVADAGFERTVKDVPAPSPPARRAAAAAPEPAPAAAKKPARAEARPAAREGDDPPRRSPEERARRRRRGWAMTGLAMAVVAAASWWLGNRHGASEADDGPALAASAPASAVVAQAVVPVAPEVVTPSVVLPMASAPAAAVASASEAAPAAAPGVRKAPARPPVAKAAASRVPVASAPVALVPPPPAATPVPTGTAAAPADAGPDSPRQACGGRLFIALMRCMKRECESARFRDHPQCQKMRRDEEPRSQR